MEHEDNGLLDLIEKTAAFDREESTPDEGSDLTFKRDEKGVLWSYDAAGNRVGRIFEHGADGKIDTIKEV